MPPNQVSHPTLEAQTFRAAFAKILPGAALRGAPPSDAQQVALQRFCALLLHWNATLNLTGSKTMESLVQEHLPDALVLAEEIPARAQVVDVGSGGGLPALPLAILRPDLYLELVEPRAKRVAFLRTAVRELRLNGVKPVLGRIEDWRGPAEGLQVAMSRATFAPAEWVERGLRLVAEGGFVFALLSGEAPAHLPASDFNRRYTLAEGQERQLARFTKTKPGG